MSILKDKITQTDRNIPFAMLHSTVKNIVQRMQGVVEEEIGRIASG